MDIFQALKNDHQEAKKLFDKLEQPPHMNGESRKKLFAKLKTTLELHSEAEEAVFYSLLRQHEEMRLKIEHAISEHDTVTKTLEELEDRDMSDSSWLNKLMHLHDDVQHHIHEEEGEIFATAQRLISRQQAEGMGQEFKKTKSHLALPC